MATKINAETISSTKAREQLADIIGKVRYGKRRFVFSSRGKAVAAIVPIDDLLLLEKLEDQHDILLAKKALEEPGNIPLEDVLAKLGIAKEGLEKEHESK